MQNNPNATLDVFSMDTDVLVLHTGYFTSLPRSTTLIRKKDERISIQENYLKLGDKRVEALIGWYAFKGTDNTGSFAGKGVASHFKAFLEADDDFLNAFSKFGLAEDIPEWIIDQMERYLCGTSGMNLWSVKTWRLESIEHGTGMEVVPETLTKSSITHMLLLAVRG